jgi:hypothetical protein
VSPASFRSNLIEMIDRARHFGARRVLLLTNHPTLRRQVMPSGEKYEEASARYSEIIRDVAADSDAQLCDTRLAFAGMDDDALASMLLPAPDVLHLSERGNRLYAEVVAPVLIDAVAAALPDERRSRR